MKNITLAAILLLSFSATASQRWIQEVDRQTKRMSIPEFCSLMGDVSYRMEGTPADDDRRHLNAALVEVHAKRALKWTQGQRDECSTALFTSYRSAMCSVEECD